MSDLLLSKIKQAAHQGLNEQQAVIAELLNANPWVPPVLNAIKTLPGAWMGAGIIFQNIWNLHHGFPLNSHIKDIDVFYWQPEDLSWEAEDQVVQTLNKKLSHLEISIDIKNIARIHLWYEQRFGIKKQAYQSVAESIASWPVIGACMAVRLKDDKLEFCAPYGFNDALNLRIRANKVLVDQNIYEDKAFKWKQQWPQLKVFDW